MTDILIGLYILLGFFCLTVCAGVVTFILFAMFAPGPDVPNDRSST